MAGQTDAAVFVTGADANAVNKSTMYKVNNTVVIIAYVLIC